MKRDDIGFWPAYLHPIFALLGLISAGKRLAPHMLKALPTARGSIVPDHEVKVRHVPAAEAKQKRGHYLITVTGPRFDGRWWLRSGELESLSRSALLADRHE